MSCICITIDSPVHNPNEGIFMAANIILLVILIFFLIVIAVFSLNLNIVVSFYASTEDEKLYQYAISLRNSATIKILSFELLRITSNKPPKKKSQKKERKKSNVGKKIKSNIKRYKSFIEIHNLSYVGQISFGTADHTALAAGVLNATAGVFTAYLGSLASKIFISRIDIRPLYNNDIKLNFLFECIVKCNAGNIIITTLNILKGSNKNVKSHKRRHVNSNEQHQGNGGCKHSDR